MELSELDAWIARQTARSVAAMEQAISATHLCRRRERFRQIITPAAGSVLASPVFADWDPEPDYFFHWVRDSALVMRTVADLMHDARHEPERLHWQQHFAHFVRLSLKITEPGDEARSFQLSYNRGAVAEADREALRPQAELSALDEDALLAEPRFNPDGTIDIFRWSRPQYDGPALRALACLRCLAAGGERTDELVRLLQRDLDFTIAHAGQPCIGPWEEPEQNAHHYYVELVQLAALVHGRAWIQGSGASWHKAEQKLRDGLKQYWSERHQVLMAMRPPVSESTDDLLDAVTLLAVWDAALPDGPHSVDDARVQRTQTAIEALFAREFPINRGRAVGPALGRSRADRYFGGGAWYPTTLAAAGLCYRLARHSAPARRALIARGDAFMTTLRDLTPADGSLSEQIDRTTGEQRSARHLTWSYAAFVSTAREHNRAIGSLT